jgi:hypothetical protein
MRLCRALDRDVTEALSAAAELQFVGLAEGLELTLLLADGEPEKYERAAPSLARALTPGDKNVNPPR